MASGRRSYGPESVALSLKQSGPRGNCVGTRFCGMLLPLRPGFSRLDRLWTQGYHLRDEILAHPMPARVQNWHTAMPTEACHETILFDSRRHYSCILWMR